MKIFTSEQVTRFWNNIKTWANGQFVKQETGKGLSTNDYTTAEKNKLAGLSKVTVDTALSGTSSNAVANKTVHAALGKKADLDSAGKVLASQLPSYVDDVVEGYYYNSKFYKEETHTNPITGESGKIYVDITKNKSYRWSGSVFVEIKSSAIVIGETATDAYRGDRGKIAYDHSQTAHAPSNAEANVQSDWAVADTGSDAFIKNKPTSLPANGGNAATVNNHTVLSNVPANAKFTDTTYSNFVGAQASAAGRAGLVPAPATGKTTSVLCSDGTWTEPMTNAEIDAICV